jgi:hypothetical protein
MKGDIKDVSASAFEPRRHAAQLVMVFQQQDAESLPRENIRRRQAGEPAADHDHIVSVFCTLKKITRHSNLEDSQNRRKLIKKFRGRLANPDQQLQTVHVFREETPQDCKNREFGRATSMSTQILKIVKSRVRRRCWHCNVPLPVLTA